MHNCIIANMLGDIEFEGRVFESKCKVNGKWYKQYKVYIPKWLGERLHKKKVRFKVVSVEED